MARISRLRVRHWTDLFDIIVLSLLTVVIKFLLNSFDSAKNFNIELVTVFLICRLLYLIKDSFSVATDEKSPKQHQYSEFILTGAVAYIIVSQVLSSKIFDEPVTQMSHAYGWAFRFFLFISLLFLLPAVTFPKRRAVEATGTEYLTYHISGIVWKTIAVRSCWPIFSQSMPVVLFALILQVIMTDALCRLVGISVSQISYLRRIYLIERVFLTLGFIASLVSAGFILF